MKIGVQKENKSFILPTLIVLILLLVVAKALMHKSPASTTVSVKEESELDKRTQIHNSKTYLELIDDEKSIIASHENLNIHLIEEFGALKILYIYKGELNERQQFDRFFLHIYLKDKSLLKKKYKWKYESLNFDFAYFKPIVISKNNVDYSIFQRELLHKHSQQKLLLEEIAHISTGRNHGKLGRSLTLEKVKCPEKINTQVDNSTIKSISIEIKEDAYNKLRVKRGEALARGVLITTDDDLVPVKITDENETNKAELRLKGDWVDHLIYKNKWSFRLILKGNKTAFGMRKFSLQHPSVRNYLWEWLFHKCIKENGLMGLRYEFADLNLNIQKSSGVEQIPIGIMALEESFDKILIENNQRREGIVIAFDESNAWDDIERAMHYKIEESGTGKEREEKNMQIAPIKVFNKSKVLSDPKLSKQFEIAKDLLDGLRKGKYKISEVYDLDKLTTFVAISNLFRNAHGLAWANLRIYYNPITNKLEPISFDANAGKRLKKIQHYPFSEGDMEYQKMLMEKLTLICNRDFVNDLMYTNQVELENLIYSLKAEYDFNFDPYVLEYNSNFIKKEINPANALTVGLLEKTEASLKLEISNLTDHTVNLKAINHIDGRKLDQGIAKPTLLAREKKVVEVALNPYFNNAFVSKKNKKGKFQFPKDLENLLLAYELVGVGLEKSCSIVPFASNQKIDESVTQYKNMFEDNLSEFDFIHVDSSSVRIKKGSYIIDHNLIVPKGKTFTIESGVAIELINGASLVSFSPVYFEGTKSEPIKFFSSDSSGRGLFISNAALRSKLNYCQFENLSHPAINGWSLSGAINFHESNVDIDNATFTSNRCEDYLNIIRSEFNLSNSTFENTRSDAFDGDFVKGSITNSTFINAGNDGIDVSGSEIALNGIVLKQPSDKAISGGEASRIVGQNIRIEGGEIGVVSKDLSKVELSNIEIIDTRLAVSAFQKKTEYGKGQIDISDVQFTNNELNYLIENGSVLMLNDTLVETVSDNVIDQMYGNEYGKSSKP